MITYQKILIILMFFMISLFNNACSFIINKPDNQIKSTHIPTIPSSGSIFNTLQGTIWQQQEDNQKIDIYLFISKTDTQYAIQQMKERCIPEQYPLSHQYTTLGNVKSLTDSSLNKNQIVIFQLKYQPNHYIGFYLKNSHLLITAEETGGYTSIIESFKKEQGVIWKLHI